MCSFEFGISSCGMRLFFVKTLCVYTPRFAFGCLVPGGIKWDSILCFLEDFLYLKILHGCGMHVSLISQWRFADANSEKTNQERKSFRCFWETLGDSLECSTEIFERKL